MKHFGAVCGPGTGHIATVSAIGRESQSRGHQLTLFNFSDAVKQTEDRPTSLVTLEDGATQGGSAFLSYMKKRAR